MRAEKAFAKGVERACSNVAEYNAEGKESETAGSAALGRCTDGFLPAEQTAEQTHDTSRQCKAL